ncbi:glycosyltransferase [Gordonia sinesedis]
MKFVLAANGSRGDVQPAVALGLELARRGHEPVMLVPPNLVEFSAGTGLHTEIYGESTRDILASDLVADGMHSRNPRTRLRAITELTVRGGRTMQQQLLDHTADADAIIATSVGQERAHNVSRVRRIPHIPLHLCPIRRNRSVSMLAHVGVDAPPAIADLSWRVVEQVLWRASRSAENILAGELGLPVIAQPFATQIAKAGVPEIQAYDPALFPRLTSQWGVARPLVGFLNLPAAYRAGVGDAPADDGLSAWIDNGDPPVYVGFGSMLPRNPDALAAAIRTAAAELDLRLLVAGGWSDFMSGMADARVRAVGHVDHDTVLPRCAAAVHHGGAGSLAAGLRAGLPTTIAWMGADQPIWGRALMKSHAGISFPMTRLDHARMTKALRLMRTAPVRAAAERIANTLIRPARAVSAAADVAENAALTSRQRTV